MLKLLNFELKKLWKSSFFRILLLIFCLFLFLYYVFVYINTIHNEDVVLERKDRFSSIQKEVNNLEDQIESREIDAEDQDYTALKGMLEEEERRLEASKKEDWVSYMNVEIEHDEPFTESLLNQGNWATLTVWPSLFTQASHLEEMKWIRDKKIVPVFPIDSMSALTAYDVFDDPNIKESTESYHDKYSSSGIYFLNHLFTISFGIFGAFFFLFLFGDVITKEGIDRGGSIQLLHTQPVPRGKILLAKFVTVIIMTVFVFVGSIILSLLTGTIFDRFGDYDYPVLIYGEDFSFTFMNMGTFLIQSAVLFFFVLLFCYSLLFLFSVLTNRTLLAVGLTLATILVGVEWGGDPASGIAPYIPFHYFAVPDIITMETAHLFENFHFTLLNGMLSLGVSSVIILLFSYVVSSARYKFAN